MILRWGRSEYETEEDLVLERHRLESLGCQWVCRPASQELPSELPEAKALVVTSKCRVDATVLERFGGDLLVTTTSGYDHIDLTAARRKGVAVCRCPEARRDAVVDHTVACLLGLLRRFDALMDAGRVGRWARDELPALAPREMSDLVVAVVGLGVIGRRVAEVLGFMGARVLGVDPAGVPEGVEACSLQEALSRASAITLHCQLTPETAGVLNRDRLEWLRTGAILVNTARGPLLDVEAAVAAVHAGRLGGLAVDVFPIEPYRRMAEASAVPGVWVFPHAAGYHRGLGTRVADGVVRAVRSWCAGEPVPYRVDV